MKTSRILVAWLLSMAVAAVFLHAVAFGVNLYENLFHVWLNLIGGSQVTGAGKETAIRLAFWSGSLVEHGPTITMSMIIFAHVAPNGLAISLRGILLVVSSVAACLAIAAIEGEPEMATWLFTCLSGLVTFGGLAWLCWQGRRNETS
jgi:hypothetical protein